MQRVTDRLEREAENLLDHPQQRRMDEFRTLGSASENVMAAQRFYDQLEPNNGEEDLTFAASSPNQNFIGSGTKFIRQAMESTNPSSTVTSSGTRFIRQTMESTNPSSSVSKMGPVSHGGKRTFSPHSFPLFFPKWVDWGLFLLVSQGGMMPLSLTSLLIIVKSLVQS
jgi:hypothetical protein